jgi:hypothetical protein
VPVLAALVLAVAAEAVLAAEAAVAAEVLALPVEAAAAGADVLPVPPPSAEIRFVKAVFKVDSVLAGRPLLDVFAPSSSLLARSFTRVCNAAMIPCWEY